MSIFGEHITSAWEMAEAIKGTLDRIESNVADAVGQIQAQEAREEFARRPLTATADAAGIADVTYDVPLGLGVKLISAACSGSAAGAGVTASIYLGGPDNEANLIHVFNYSDVRFSSLFAEGEYVDSGGRIVIRFRGQAVGQKCTANLKLMVLNPTDPILVR